MNAFHQKRAWFWIAVAAITIALVALLVPHIDAHGNLQPDWVALLPVFFVGLLVPFGLKPLMAVLSLGHAPSAPSLAASLPRPPPFPLA